MWVKDTPLGESPVFMVSSLRSGPRLCHLGQLKAENWQPLLFEEPKKSLGQPQPLERKEKFWSRDTEGAKPQVLCINSAPISR